MVGGLTRSEIFLNKSPTASKYEMVFEHGIKTKAKAVETISDEISAL